MKIKYNGKSLELKIIPRELTAVIVGEGTEAFMLMNCPCPTDVKTLREIKKKVEEKIDMNPKWFEDYLQLNKTLLEGDKHES